MFELCARYYVMTLGIFWLIKIENYVSILQDKAGFKISAVLGNKAGDNACASLREKSAYLVNGDIPLTDIHSKA